METPQCPKPNTEKKLDCRPDKDCINFSTNLLPKRGSVQPLS